MGFAERRMRVAEAYCIEIIASSISIVVADATRPERDEAPLTVRANKVIV